MMQSCALSEARTFARIYGGSLACWPKMALSTLVASTGLAGLIRAQLQVQMVFGYSGGWECAGGGSAKWR